VWCANRTGWREEGLECWPNSPVAVSVTECAALLENRNTCLTASVLLSMSNLVVQMVAPAPTFLPKDAESDHAASLILLFCNFLLCFVLLSLLLLCSAPPSICSS
jgi:hypothetical protein